MPTSVSARGRPIARSGARHSPSDAADASPTTPAAASSPAPEPSRRAFLLAFPSVVVAGLFGGVIGYGLVDVGCDRRLRRARSCSARSSAAVVAAIGVGVVAVLVLRAMAEWQAASRGSPVTDGIRLRT